jgi:membrane-associated phospholipid phosphatase
MNAIIMYIGLWAPVILFILSLFLLYSLPTFFNFFLGGYIINAIFNLILKTLIKQPRPSQDKKLIEIGVVNGHRFSLDKYGMPSGHAQTCGFSLTFVALALQNFFVTTVYIIISIITLFQRYLNKNHTIIQLIVGFVLGLIFGYITFLIAQKYVQGNVKMKPDEDALN